MSPIEWLSLIVALGSVSAAVIVIFLMRSEKKEEVGEPVEVPRLGADGFLLPRTKKSVTHTEAVETKNKLRILSVEREILSYAIRRLYEAQAEGKISEDERDRLAESYKEDMRRINEEVSRGESIIALDELEGMQEDLLKLFNERFDELSKRIEEMRLRSGIEVVVAEEKPALATPTEPYVSAAERKKKELIRREPTTPTKTEAEQKVEQIMAEVEKVLARLEQMEVSE